MVLDRVWKILRSKVNRLSQLRNRMPNRGKGAKLTSASYFQMILIRRSSTGPLEHWRRRSVKADLCRGTSESKSKLQQVHSRRCQSYPHVLYTSVFTSLIKSEGSFSFAALLTSAVAGDMFIIRKNEVCRSPLMFHRAVLMTPNQQPMVRP